MFSPSPTLLRVSIILTLALGVQVVRSICAYFMIISYWALPPWHLLLVVASGGIALAAYLLYSCRSHCGVSDAAHVIVHVFSSLGVLLYTAGLVAQRQADSAA